MKSKSILVTGFGPFAGHAINASWQSVQLLPDEVNGIKVIKKEVPVEYVYVESEIPQLWKEHTPMLVVHVGVSSEATKITIEKCANRDGYNICDSAGLIHPSGLACTDGSDCIFTEIDIEAVQNSVNNTGKLQSCVSDNAGRYLCEFIYYTSLNVDPSRTLFVHVPPLNMPYSAQELSDGLLEIIKCALEQITQQRDKCESAVAVC
ncbi:unnamed protein product [Diabrotica balteata]|uniref:Pyroglutamyl-peptidase I n=1 Tax=Diabrotica balteata TaxID=107213 RepID=A0A9N9X9B9_DIABA|nr:unnamed protein product [Diabrotica balteata]